MKSFNILKAFIGICIYSKIKKTDPKNHLNNASKSDIETSFFPRSNIPDKIKESRDNMIEAFNDNNGTENFLIVDDSYVPNESYSNGVEIDTMSGSGSKSSYRQNEKEISLDFGNHDKSYYEVETIGINENKKLETNKAISHNSRLEDENHIKQDKVSNITDDTNINEMKSSIFRNIKGLLTLGKSNFMNNKNPELNIAGGVPKSKFYYHILLNTACPIHREFYHKSTTRRNKLSSSFNSLNTNQSNNKLPIDIANPTVFSDQVSANNKDNKNSKSFLKNLKV